MWAQPWGPCQGMAGEADPPHRAARALNPRARAHAAALEAAQKVPCLEQQHSRCPCPGMADVADPPRRAHTAPNLHCLSMLWRH